MNEPATILVAENDEPGGKDLQTTLQRLGYRVLGPALTTDQAASLARDETPDLALINLHAQGELDGIETASRLKSGLGILTVFYSDHGDEVLYQRAQDVGAAGFLRQPFFDGELKAVLDANLGKHSATEDPLSASAVLRTLEQPAILCRPDGTVAAMNAAAEALCRWKTEEASGRQLETVLDIRDAGNPETGEPATLRARNGYDVSIFVREQAISNELGVSLGKLITITKAEEASGDGEEGDPPAAKEEPDRLYTPFRVILGLGSAEPPAGETTPEPEPGSAEPGFEEAAETPGEPGGEASPDESAGSANEPQKEPNQPQSQGITDPLFTLDREWRVIDANPVAFKLLGEDDPEILGLSFWEKVPLRHRQKYFPVLHSVMESGQPRVVELQLIKPRQWFEASCYPHEDRMVLLLRDITAKKVKEAERLRIQRLEGLGLLARGFAHDFNNLLTILIGNLALARDRYPEDDDFSLEIGSAQKAALDARGLVQQLLTFAKGGVAIREPVCVPDLIRVILDERRRQHPKIRYQFQCADPAFEAPLDREQIVRLLLNLVSNGENAITGRGNLIARCGKVSRSAVLATDPNMPVSAEDYLLIEVIDTGQGMSEEVLERAFEPYFTTHPHSNSAGIGLTVCESIAKAHDGFIMLQSKEGRGTIASFFMPLIVEAPEGGFLLEQTGGRATAPPRGRSSSAPFIPGATTSRKEHARILVLEDEPMIRALVSTCLRRDGYEVVETEDGRDTLRVFVEAQQAGHPFDLILSDLTIPGGMGGVDTMRELRKLDSEIPAIVSSGYSDDPAMAQPERYGFNAVLPKPYPPEDLRRTVRELLMGTRV